MSNESILRDIQALAKTLGDTASEGLDNSRKMQFYKEILKDIAFQVFEKAQQIGQDTEEAKVKPVEPETKAAPGPVVKSEPIAPAEEILPPPVAIPVPEPKAEIKAPASEPAAEIVPEPVAEPVAVVPPVPEPVPAPQPVAGNEEKNTPAPKVQPQSTEDVHSRLSKSHQQMNLADKHKETPIADLPKAISISKKFEFINGLFDGKPEVYKETIAGVEISGSYDSAIKLLEDKVFPDFDWSDNEQLASEFMNLVKRRYM